MLRRDKAGWTQEASGLTSETIVSLVGTLEEGLTALGNKGTVLKRTSGRWTADSARPLTQSGASGVAACTVQKTGELWGVGTQGVIMRRSGTEWLSNFAYQPTVPPALAALGPMTSSSSDRAG